MKPFSEHLKLATEILPRIPSRITVKGHRCVVGILRNKDGKVQASYYYNLSKKEICKSFEADTTLEACEALLKWVEEEIPFYDRSHSKLT